jgi:rifampicin phosphotransferase
VPPVELPAGESPAFEALRNRLSLLPGWKRHRVMTGQIVDSRITALRRMVDDAVEWLALRERTKRALLGVGGELRRTDLTIGEHLHAVGHLQSPTDIELVGNDELVALAEGRGPSLATLARRRHALDWAAAQPPLPQQFTGPPPDQPPSLPEGDILRGWGAGPGLYHGRTIVVDQPVGAELEPGDVLVARSTDASWSPLFLSAGAIVTEEGGPLSHAAIVARELGIPAVLNVAGAVARFRDRQETVTVDGEDGIVVIHGADDG